ncbi:MAG: FAD-binding protein, partial [Actinobacteria bacterium]|nr:FAD-binding protein [Actinomycetota bacterium]
AQAAAVTTVNGYALSYVTSFFGPKPLTAGDGMRALADVAAKEGVEFFYSTPGVQLVKDGDKVIGVIGKNADGTYTQFNASKGVILATGDYQNDEEMCDYYLPDIHNFERKQMGKTGDGHKMGVWAGGKIEDLNHTKMLHDFDAGPAPMCDMPFMTVNDMGERFSNETTEMSLLNNYLRQADRTGWYTQVFDSKYEVFAATWPGKVVPPAGLKTYMPDDTAEKKGVFADLVRTFECATLDELAAKLEIDPATFKASVARYNEMVAAGADTDFGVPADKLFTIDTPPFYGIHRHLRVSAIVSGLDIDENSQCLTPEGTPIPGLFAAGNCAGKFYGGVDYPMTLPGLSLGRCYTFGRVVGQFVAKL